MTRRAPPALIAPSLALLLCASAAAQNQRTYPIQPFALTDWGGELFLESQYSQRTESQDGGDDTDERDIFFQEGIQLQGHGYSYHPNLADWDAMIRLGLDQSLITVDEDQFNSYGTLLGYNFSSLFLKEKPVSVLTYASQSQDFANRDFARRVQTDTTRQGIEIFNRDPFPASLLYEHSALDEQGDVLSQEQETHLVRLTSTFEEDAGQFVRLTYEHEQTDLTSISRPLLGGPTTSRDLPTTRDELSAVNRWQWGEGVGRKALTGTMRATHREGFFPNDLFTLNQRFDWQHTETLGSFYELDFLYDETDVQTERRTRLEAGPRLEIFDSLILTGRLFGIDEDFGTGTSQSIGAALEADYRKDTPIGRYRSTLLLSRQYQVEQSTSGSRLVRGETVTLVALGASRLDVPNVIPGTVTVFNLARTLTYLEGVDYELNAFGAFTEISRLPASAIADGETVLADYQVSAAPDTETFNDRLSWTHRIDLDDLPLAFFAEYHLLNETLIDGEDPGDLETQHILVGGAELTLFDVVTTYEHEYRQLELAPSSHTDRLRVRYNKPLSRDVTLSLGGTAQYIQYLNVEEFGLDPDDDFLQSLSANASLTTRIGRTALLRVFGDAFQNQGREEDLLGRVGISFDWRYRDLNMSLSARNEFFEEDSTRGNAQLIMFELHRRF